MARGKQQPRGVGADEAVVVALASEHRVGKQLRGLAPLPRALELTAEDRGQVLDLLARRNRRAQDAEEARVLVLHALKAVAFCTHGYWLSTLL